MYVYCRANFARIEFWVIYIINLGWLGALIGLSLKQEAVECQQIIILKRTLLIIGAKFQGQMLLALILPFEVAQRQTSLASNQIFSYLLLTKPTLSTCTPDGHNLIFSIVFVHAFSLILGTVMNFVLSCIGKNGKRKSTFKFFIMITSLSMIFQLVLIIIL